MTKFLAGVLSVIAVGVLLIAYGLLNVRAAAFDPGAPMNPVARPMMANERMMVPQDPSAWRYTYGEGYAAPAPYGYGQYPPAQPAYAYPAAQPAYAQPVMYAPVQAQPVRTVVTTPAPRPIASRRVDEVERGPRRDWKKTALVIGGSTAGGAGVGAIFGGKKGALIGAAIGGGASTIYEASK
jgi:uncharacterized protein YcfJ